MLKLNSSIAPLNDACDSTVQIRRITDDPNFPRAERENELLLIRRRDTFVQPGFAGYLFLESPVKEPPANSFLLDPALSYLSSGDIVRINPKRHAIRALYRRTSPHNAILMTERCDNFCLMCSQPPKEIDDSHIVNDVLEMIPLMAADTKEVCLTGGEPTLLGHNLLRILQCFKQNLPHTGIHILSNGRGFKDWTYADSVGGLNHPDLMVGIPVYSDISSLHDYVVQADGAFDDTIRGIINLKSAGVKVEIRIVIHRLTYQRLPDWAVFVRRNLTFCDHVALMGLEMTGFTKFNLEKLWIDPVEYQAQLREAVETLAQARMQVSIYNHQLCLLDPALAGFSRKSISDWKNEYMPECRDCTRMNECGGFFSSAKLRYSSHIKPFR